MSYQGQIFAVINLATKEGGKEGRREGGLAEHYRLKVVCLVKFK